MIYNRVRIIFRFSPQNYVFQILVFDQNFSFAGSLDNSRPKDWSDFIVTFKFSEDDKDPKPSHRPHQKNVINNRSLLSYQRIYAHHLSTNDTKAIRLKKVSSTMNLKWGRNPAQYLAGFLIIFMSSSYELLYKLEKFYTKLALA